MCRRMLIGLTGPARSGKDTVGDYLIAKHSFNRLSFAGPLKAMLMVGLNLDREQVNGNRKEEPIDWLDGVTPRSLMQTLGTEWGRQQHPDLWLRIAEQRIVRAGPETDIVFTDVRFDNEAKMIRSYGGNIFHISRNDVEIISGVKGHASESGVGFSMGICQDFFLLNNHTFESLYNQVEVVIHGIRSSTLEEVS